MGGGIGSGRRMDVGPSPSRADSVFAGSKKLEETEVSEHLKLLPNFRPNIPIVWIGAPARSRTRKNVG